MSTLKSNSIAVCTVACLVMALTAIIAYSVGERSGGKGTSEPVAYWEDGKCRMTKVTVDQVEFTNPTCQPGSEQFRKAPIETPYQNLMRLSAEEGQLQKWGSVEQHGGHHTVPDKG